MTKVGPLLRRALEGERTGARTGIALATATDGHMRLFVQISNPPPRPGETWPEFKDRSGRALAALNDSMLQGNGRPLFLAGTLAVAARPEQAVAFAENAAVRLVELAPIVNPTSMDDSIVDLGVIPMRSRLGAQFTGTGVRVAVLDSGVDTQHLHLKVEDSVSTCGEDVALPGMHGTHVAGSIASRDATFPGIAPDVSLINVKVLRQDGAGEASFVQAGLDAALDRRADVISMSLGFNHLPFWSDGGHGWTCPDGRCPVCTAVDYATSLGATVVVAAGNEHQRAEALRRRGEEDSFDTELGCPGQARGAVTVGAITKRTFALANFSSHGPTSYKEPKPDLVGPGVNVTSTIPVPRLADGSVNPDPARSALFRRLSGTSMATPIVAGAVALIIQHRRAQGLPVDPAAVKRALLTEATSPLEFGREAVGVGRIDFSRYGVGVPIS